MLEAAEAEARELGHVRIGTEHLLLALLADESGGASSRLRAAGATLAGARHKVGEAVVVRGRPPSGSLPQSPRASRALVRAARFAHQDRCETPRSEHVLQGVLDVEGTANLVLRGLGVDVDALRVQLAGGEPAAAPVADEPAPMRCPSCRVDLDLAATPVSADGTAATVVSCRSCGHVLGVSGR